MPDLDFGRLVAAQKAMKLPLLALASVALMVPTYATTITLDGDLTWNVTEPRCSFQLKGNIKNSTPLSSGPLKLLLWATPNPFPSQGYIVAEYTLGSINGGYQFSNFTVKAPSKVPSVSGEFNFTIAIAEYDGARWKNVVAVTTGKKTLELGNFSGQQKWLVPTKVMMPPLGVLTAGDVFNLSLKATDEKNLFPSTLQEKTVIVINSKTQLRSTLRSVGRSAKYTYASKFGKLGNLKVDFGQLTVVYDPKTKGASKAVYSLYFHTLTSGIYRCVETNSAGKDTTWGTFK